MLYAQAVTCTKVAISKGKIDLSTVVAASIVDAKSAAEAQQDGLLDLLDIYPETDGFSGHSCTVLPIPDEIIVQWAQAIVERDLANLEQED